MWRETRRSRSGATWSAWPRTGRSHRTSRPGLGSTRGPRWTHEAAPRCPWRWPGRWPNGLWQLRPGPAGGSTHRSTLEPLEELLLVDRFHGQLEGLVVFRSGILPDHDEVGLLGDAGRHAGPRLPR